jgi:hypothetical protein
MGAGDELFGEVIPDPLAPANDPIIAARPPALLFDPVTRDFPLDANGQYVPIHPVDAAVEVALLHLANRIPCDPNSGWPEQKLGNYLDPRTADKVSKIIRSQVVIARLVAAGDITIDRIDYDGSQGGPEAAFYYWNNRLAKRTETPAVKYLRTRSN